MSGRKKPKLKVVVRHLPAHLPVETFQSTLQAYSQSITECDYRQGKPGEKPGQPYKFYSAAFISFDSVDNLVRFSNEYNGWKFASGKTGTVDYAQVEYAPFQSTSREGIVPDRELSSCSEYAQFVAKLETSTVADPLSEFQEKDASEDIVLDNGQTPLLKFLAARGPSRSAGSGKGKKSRNARKNSTQPKAIAKNDVMVSGPSQPSVAKKEEAKPGQPSAKKPARRHKPKPKPNHPPQPQNQK